MTRRGFSLVIVLVLTSALLFVAVAFTDAVLHASRAARLGWHGERATHAADAALLGVIAAWDRGAAVRLRTGESDTLPDPGGAAGTRVIRTRLSARTYAAEARAEIREGAARTARRTLGRTVRLTWPSVPALGALTAAGSVEIGSGATVFGADVVPAGWSDECTSDERLEPSAAVVARNAEYPADAVVAGAGAPVRLLSDSAAAVVGAAFDQAVTVLASRATRTTGDSVLSLDALAGGSPACPVWFGDARRSVMTHDACTRRWPVVVATHPGAVRLTGTTPAQGVLVVSGDLHVDAGVSFAGVALVGGRVLAHPAPGEAPVQFLGALVVRDRDARGSRLAGPVLLQAGRCPIRLALAGAGVPAPVGRHGWTERP